MKNENKLTTAELIEKLKSELSEMSGIAAIAANPFYKDPLSKFEGKTVIYLSPDIPIETVYLIDKDRLAQFKKDYEGKYTILDGQNNEQQE